MQKSDLFFCYDFSLRNKFSEKGIRYVTTAISNNQKRFWLYIRTPEINEIIKEHLSN